MILSAAEFGAFVAAEAQTNPPRGSHRERGVVVKVADFEWWIPAKDLREKVFRIAARMYTADIGQEATLKTTLGAANNLSGHCADRTRFLHRLPIRRIGWAISLVKRG